MTEEVKPKFINIRIDRVTYDRLNDLVEKRKEGNSFIKSKISIVNELVWRAHNRECKQ